VASIVAGWGIAQSPDLLPGLTIEDAAAGRSTLWALLISIAAGLVILVPSLALLYGLLLRGRFDLGRAARQEPPQPQATGGARGLAAAAVTLLVAGVPLTLFADGIGLAIGVLSLVGFIALGAIEFLRLETLPDD
jgi:cytochrome d ubiquinol oxidase subunit II